MRFQVTDLRGFNEPGRWTTAEPGLSCTVVDTAWNFRVMAQFRSEAREYSTVIRRHWTGQMRKIGGPRAIGRERCRELARLRCDELNAAVRS